MSQFKQYTPPPSIGLPLLLMGAFAVLTYILLLWTWNRYRGTSQLPQKKKNHRHHHHRRDEDSDNDSSSSSE